MPGLFDSMTPANAGLFAASMPPMSNTSRILGGLGAIAGDLNSTLSGRPGGQYSAFQDDIMRRKLLQQMAQQQQGQSQALLPAIQNILPRLGPDAARAFQQAVAAGADPMETLQKLQSLVPKPAAPIITKPGDIGRDPGDPTKVIFENASPDEFETREVKVGDQLKYVRFNKKTGEPVGFVDGLGGPRDKPAQTNVNVNMAGKFDENLVGGASKILDETSAAARGAVPMIENGQQIMQALDSGKVMAGPGATLRVIGAQLGAVLGGRDASESLLKTREVIRGLAEATLQARQLLRGQGPITDQEQAVAQKARSGNIDDLTTDEIRLLVKAQDRLARKVIEVNEDYVSRAGKVSQNPGILDMYRVTPPGLSGWSIRPAGGQ